MAFPAPPRTGVWRWERDAGADFDFGMETSAVTSTDSSAAAECSTQSLHQSQRHWPRYCSHFRLPFSLSFISLTIRRIMEAGSFPFPWTGMRVTETPSIMMVGNLRFDFWGRDLVDDATLI